MFELSLIDTIIVIFYFLITLFVGFKFAKSKTSIEEYFCAKGNIGWFVLGLAAFATNTSSGTALGVASSSYRYGLVVLNFELTGIFACLALAYVFGPVYLQNNILTVPQYLEKRYNATCRIWFSIFTIITHIFTKISIYILAAVVLLEQIVSVDIYTLMLTITLVTGIYSVVGGQRPIIYTEAFQAFFIIGAGLILLFFTWQSAGGVSVVTNNLSSDYLEIIKPMSDEKFPWLAVLVALPFVGIWYHCADAEMAQKFFAGKNLEHSQASTVFLGYLKLLIIPLMVLPAMFSTSIYPDIDPGLTYPTMVQNLPVIFKGIVIAGFLAATMSSLSASYNACSTLYTFDIYRKMYPRAQNFILINIGKIATIFIVILSINWVVLIRYMQGDLFHLAASGFAFMAPPIVAVYLLGILWKRATAKAATMTLIIGGFMGISMIVLEILVAGKIITGGVIFIFVNLAFFYVALIFLIICFVLIIVISYLGEAPPKGKINTTTFQSYLEKKRSAEPDHDLDRLRKKTFNASVILVGIIVLIYLALA